MKAIQVAIFVVFAAMCFARATAVVDAGERAAMVAIRTYVPELATDWTDYVISYTCQYYTPYVFCRNGHISELVFSFLSHRTTVGTLGDISGLRYLKSLEIGTNMSIPNLDVWYTQLYNLTSLAYNNLESAIPNTPVFSANFNGNPFLNTLFYGDTVSTSNAPNIINAPALAYLTISMPQLQSMPPNYFAGKNLVSLSLASTGSTSGSILEFPDFSHMTSLQGLTLSSTSIRELQNNFTNLVNLRSLTLANCHSLVKIPSSVSQCSNLQYLAAPFCQLNRVDSLPDFSATKLETLILFENSISAWPSGLCQLSTNPGLDGLNLDLRNNPLLNPPACFVNVTRLYQISFSGAQFTSIPTLLINMPSIANFYLLDSPLMVGSVPDLSGMTSLMNLQISNTTFTGPFPRLPSSLTTAYLNSNRFSGPIPDNAFVDYPMLSYLDLSNNDFVGPFPSSIRYTRLSHLAAANNSFTSLPYTLGLVQNLFSLDFSSNSLHSIPEEAVWRNISYLTSVILSNNRNLNGPLPTFWNGRSSYMQHIDLSGCSFTGNVPSLNSTNLRTLILSDNALDGVIMPIIFGNTLEIFKVDRNQLSGPIPSSIGTPGTGLVNVAIFDVSFNRLTGTIPASISNTFGSLIQFIFNNNGIEGSLPVLTFATKLQVLKGHNTNIRLCDVNPGISISSGLQCLLYAVSFPGSCGCDSWYSTCTTDTTCPSPDYVAPPVSPPAFTSAPTPILPPGSSPILPPGSPPGFSPNSPPGSQTPSVSGPGSGPPLPTNPVDPSGSPTPTGNAVSNSLHFSALLLASLIGVLLF